MAPPKTPLTFKDYLKISLRLTTTNHFELEAKINGISGRFILDTGASNTCIGLDKATTFHLAMESSEVKVAGAGAIDMETFQAKNNTIEIGAWKKRRQKIVLFDLAHVNQALTQHRATPVDGIIGADLLKKSKAIIDYGGKKLYLKL